MKQNKNTLALAFAAIGVCAVVYGAWYFYRQSAANEQSRACLHGATSFRHSGHSTRNTRSATYSASLKCGLSSRPILCRGRIVMGTFDDIANQFNLAGLKYSAAIQPFAIKLFVGLLILDILVTWIQFVAEGQLDGSFFLGRLIKHVLTGGFVYLMIVNALPWMEAVLNSFSRIGAAATGLPALSPQTVLQLGGNMASTIFNTPPPPA